MKSVFLIFLTLIFFLMSQITDAQTPQEFAADWEANHITDKFPSNVRHENLKAYLEKLKKLGIKIEQVGSSYADREIYQVQWGKGSTKIFMWSQMHGDEPTATSALIDMFAFLQTNRDKKDWIKQLENTVTIRAVPMLNPDGTEFFVRRNLQSIDINRDAQDLITPEGRLLKKLRDEWRPEIGFNLHNQQELTTVGRTNIQATISLLAVSGREKGETYEGHERNKRISSLVIQALNNFIKNGIGRYDDSYNPRAFGDRFAEWGTPVILVETGGFQRSDERFLVKLNFIAYLTALQAIATGSEKQADPKIYEKTPFNSSGRIYNFIFRNANIINYTISEEPFQADIALNRERRREQFPKPTYVREIGRIDQKGLNEFDVGKYYLIPREGILKLGSSGEFYFYKKDRTLNFQTEDFTKINPPDAIFSLGKWIKGKELFVKEN